MRSTTRCRTWLLERRHVLLEDVEEEQFVTHNDELTNHSELLTIFEENFEKILSFNHVRGKNI